jgi:hypothetical protein
MRYGIVFKPSAKREFDRLDRPVKVRTKRSSTASRRIHFTSEPSRSRISTGVGRA